jgi:diaminopropionate ammonia-lyase
VRAYANPPRRGALEPRPGAAPLRFHCSLPGYRPTPLLDLPTLAAGLGLGQMLVKLESSRLGLPSFKILGASWAIRQLLADRLGRELEPTVTLEELAGEIDELRPVSFAAATDGNHGRAVARVAALLGCDARIYVPAGVPRPAVDAIAGEGAEVVIVDDTYDEAVERSAREADDRCLVVSDTAWPGYEQVPQWVIEGYSTMLVEVDEELERRGEGRPDLVVVQIGVGALAAAVALHVRGGEGPGPLLVGVEPADAACLLETVAAGHVVKVPGPHDSIMTGLNCGAPSLVGLPNVAAGFDLFVAVEDDWARKAVGLLAANGVTTGPTGAAGLAGLLALLDDGHGLIPDVGDTTSALLFCTEG